MTASKGISYITSYRRP